MATQVSFIVAGDTHSPQNGDMVLGLSGQLKGYKYEKLVGQQYQKYNGTFKWQRIIILHI
jgi:hypothetical protein